MILEYDVRHTAATFWIRAPGAGEIRVADLPAPGPDDVVVRTLFSGVSRGTETLVFRGEVPPSQYTSMRAPFPVSYTHLTLPTNREV